jgi:GGDEF domain-containing protein
VGGDEFVVLLWIYTQQAEQKAADLIANSIRTKWQTLLLGFRGSYDASA